MRAISKEELKVILEKHKQWLDNILEGYRADLSNADLRGADLSRVNLREADLRWADLSGATLINATIQDILVSSPIYTSALGRHTIIITADTIFIGCEQGDWDYWNTCIEEIGKVNGYTDLEIKRYKLTIKALQKMILDELKDSK